MKKLLALFALSRPVNGLITACSVAVGALTSGGPPNLALLCLAALSAALINGAGNVFNDLIDIDIDRINRPNRPLPSGRVSPQLAKIQTALLTVAGCLLALWISPLHGLLAATITALLAIYSILLKNSTLWGNLLIGVISAMAFVYGALALGPIGRSWIPAAFALTFHVGREIVKDIEDMAGDRLRGENTLPLRLGPIRAAQTATVIYIALVLFTLIPYLWAIYSTSYLLLVCVVDALVLYALWRLYRERENLCHDRLGRLLKTGMLIGLLAIVAGELSRSAP